MTHDISKEKLKELYCDEELSQIEIANKLGVCQGTISRKLRNYGIETRDRVKTVDISEDVLRKLYIEKEMTTIEISKHIDDVSFSTIRNKLKEYGIERRSQGCKEEDHHNWKENTTRDYGYNWSEQRKKALKRDSYVCQICGSTTSLHVHHKKPRRTFNHDEDDWWVEANKLSNLITICRSCHIKIHGRP